jgi:hypothetical protein
MGWTRSLHFLKYTEGGNTSKGPVWARSGFQGNRVFLGGSGGIPWFGPMGQG